MPLGRLLVGTRDREDERLAERRPADRKTNRQSAAAEATRHRDARQPVDVERLGVPPADAWGVATFYALLATSPRPKRVLHVCTDIACVARGAHAIEHALERECGPAISAAPAGDTVVIDDARGAWMLWMASPGHLANAVDPAMRDVGFGSAVGRDGHTYWCTVYGRTG